WAMRFAAARWYRCRCRTGISSAVCTSCATATSSSAQGCAGGWSCAGRMTKASNARGAPSRVAVLCARDSRRRRGLLGGKHQFTVLQGNAFARMTIHAHAAGAVADPVFDLIADYLFLLIVVCVATALGSGIGVVLLHPLLSLVTGITASCGPGYRSNLLAGAPANLIAEYTADHGAGHAAQHLVLVLDGLLAGDSDVSADLTGNPLVFLELHYIEHVGMGGCLVR